MAKQVIAYTCEHGCRRNSLLLKTAMEKHEAICFNNPDTRSCATCSFWNRVDDSAGDASYCSAEVSEKLTTNCETWEAKCDE